MRQIPYDDETFNYIFEHCSMCHLTKADTAVAIKEMCRVLKPRGIAFMGVVSQDCWPLSSYGEERSPGERWMIEGGEETCHSLFTDQESDQLLTAWDITLKEKAIATIGGESLSEEEWSKLHPEAPTTTSTFTSTTPLRNRRTSPWVIFKDPVIACCTDDFAW